MKSTPVHQYLFIQIIILDCMCAAAPGKRLRTLGARTIESDLK